MMHTRLNDARVFVRGFAYGSVAPLAMGIVCLVGTSTANADDERPNIILAMTDDQGWAETGYNGHPSLKTPVLDEMAAQGLRFDRSYSGDPVCSPTRASVMTGRAPVRSGVLHWNYALRPEELTVAEILQAAGYRTGHFGKWHLGPVKKTSPSNPARHGFDEYLSHDNFFDLDPPLSRNGDPPTVHRGESSEIIVDAAIEFILKAKQEKKPFFTVIWFGSPHGPYHGTKKDLEIYSEVQDETLRNRFAEITAMDRALGTLRKALDKADVRENTLLWFCGDNGVPANVAPRDSLRGGKGQMFEGGLRVPGILEWPAGIRKPAQSGVPCVTSDILPTVLDIAGIAYPADRPLDGISLRSVLDGRMTKRPSPIGFWKHELSWPPREQKTAETEPWFGNPSALLGTTPNGRGEVHQFANIKYLHPRTSGFGGSFAWIDNDWKLVSPGRGTVLLFNVAHDPRETHDLAKQDPERVVRMRAALTTWQASVEKSLSGADYGEGEGGDP